MQIFWQNTCRALYSTRQLEWWVTQFLGKNQQIFKRTRASFRILGIRKFQQSWNSFCSTIKHNKLNDDIRSFVDKSTLSRQLFWGGVLRCQCDEHKFTSETRVITMRVQFLVFSQGLSLLSVSIQSVAVETRLNPHGADSDVRIAGQRGDSSSRWDDKKCRQRFWPYTQHQRRRMRRSSKVIWSAVWIGQTRMENAECWQSSLWNWYSAPIP